MDAAALAGLNPFGIFDVEAARLDHFFAGWTRRAGTGRRRCAGWSVQDVLAHLAGEELYNHACLNGDLDGFRAMVRAAGHHRRLRRVQPVVRPAAPRPARRPRCWPNGGKPTRRPGTG